MSLLLTPLMLACGGGGGSGGGGSGDPGPSTAVPDPARESTVPTGWQWALGRTEAGVNAIRGKGDRIIDLEMAPSGTGSFDAVFVQDTGTYERTDGWWFGQSPADVTAHSEAVGYRILDIEPYMSGGQVVFATNVVKNEGVAAKTWRWNYDLTAEQVTADIDAYGIRLTDLEPYDVGGVRRYAYVGIENKGVDARAWWWWHDVNAQFITDRIAEHGARILDIEVHANGTFSAILIENDGSHWGWGFGLTQDRVTELIATSATRIIDLERYVLSERSYYTYVSLDNANAETRRLRSLINQAFDPPEFGDAELRGFLVKEVGGGSLAAMADTLPFQPYSTLKLLPYLAALIDVDKGIAKLDETEVSWIEYMTGDPAIDNYKDCVPPGTPDTQWNSALYADALPTMMWESHNRTLEAFFDLYHPATVLTPLAQSLGLHQTEMYPGCDRAGYPHAAWLANRSTLQDLARLFEGVETLQSVSKTTTQEAFFDNMINWSYTGASYTSPITGASLGPNTLWQLRPIAQREAGPSKQGIVEDFLQHVKVRTKGGSVGGAEFGYSGVSHLTVPFKQSGQVVLKTYVVGWFITRLQSPPGCPKPAPGACQALWGPELSAQSVISFEVFAAPMRAALATWP